jgi:hypothetical protein
MSNRFCGWKASWAFVSVFYFSPSVISLTHPSQCVGETPDGEDFEVFIGAEKANEIKQLFSSWVYNIYRKLSSTIHQYLCLLVCRVSCVRLAPLH